MKFSVFQLSRKGGRVTNEDRMGYCFTLEAGLFLLADGMGGHAEGEVAAQLALQTIAAQFQREAQPKLPDVKGFLASSLMEAHRQIGRYAVRKKMADSPRTTLVAVVLQDGAATWVHCGDSRLYWMRKGELLARTRDHSFIELERSGIVLPDVKPINRNVLYTCLGASQRPVFDIDGPHSLEADDRLLLCSDGLWDALPEQALLDGMKTIKLDNAVPALVEAALQAAGSKSDNVTALAVQWLKEIAEIRPPLPEAGEGHETLFETSVQPEVEVQPATEVEDFDESEMDRAIADIREAIHRASSERSA